MKKNRFLLTFVTGVALMTLAACDSTVVERHALENNPRFWQRADVTEAAYMEGAKTQQMLHRDISRCVAELKELERLGTLRTVIPADTMINGGERDPLSPEGALAQWETPKRDGALRAEFSDYSDFETCMHVKGWERLEHVPYDVAERSRETYVETILHEQYRTKSGAHESESSTPVDDSDWAHLND